MDEKKDEPNQEKYEDEIQSTFDNSYIPSDNAERPKLSIEKIKMVNFNLKTQCNQQSYFIQNCKVNYGCYFKETAPTCD